MGIRLLSHTIAAGVAALVLAVLNFPVGQIITIVIVSFAINFFMFWYVEWREGRGINPLKPKPPVMSDEVSKLTADIVTHRAPSDPQERRKTVG